MSEGIAYHGEEGMLMRNVLALRAGESGPWSQACLHGAETRILMFSLSLLVFPHVHFGKPVHELTPPSFMVDFPP